VTTHAVPRARVFTAAEIAQPCVAVEHGVFGDWCATHEKVMACPHACSAKWRTPCDVAGCEDAK
jgi:hypothetical protein